MSKPPNDPDGHHEYESSSTVTEPTSTTERAGLLSRLRGLPRFAWLSLSVAVFLTGSLGWYLRQRNWQYAPPAVVPETLSWEWWNQPLVRHPDAGLPEITGRLYGVAVQPRNNERDRIWVVGPGGFLAYSDDNGYCWVSYEYDGAIGAFREPETNACTPPLISRGQWLDLVPTVMAAAPPQASSAPSKRAVPPPRDVQPRSSNPKMDSAPQQSIPSQSAPATTSLSNAPQAKAGGVVISPTMIDFGELKLSEPSPKQGPPASASREFRISNLTREPIVLGFSDFKGD